ncbi:MAG: hydrogenase [Methanocorpusculum sp.]|nr:hydrogenase [Methanocorpusculum sp.]
MIGELSTGFGVWNPIVWLAAVACALLLSFLLWKCGEHRYDRGTEQTKPYLSGNDEPQKDAVHIRGGNMYWGFTQALKGYYRRLIPLHSGILNDYLSWFLIGLLALFAVVMIV